MAPKKGTKMSLNDFLGDSSLGSWADEMDNLPTAPSMKTDEERARDREGRRDFGRDREFPSRDFPPREELPLPTRPPYIAFVGNLAFDIDEDTIANFFSPNNLKDIKIIMDRDGKPKGFGYVEFESLDMLKDGLGRSGGQMAGRTVRISVAEPPKERGGAFDDDRFAGPWRREGPLPPLSSSRPGPPDREQRSGFGGGSRFGDADAESGAAEANSDWRSNRAVRNLPPPVERPPPSRRSSVVPPDTPTHAAYAEQSWSKGSRFTPSESSAPPERERKSLFGGSRGDAVAGTGPVEEVNDWRAAPRRTISQSDSQRGSPTTSTPPTPQLGNRRKLELLPRGASSPASDSPVTSPKLGSTSAKASPFGAAKPVDAAAREKEVEARIEAERERLARTSSTSAPRSSPWGSSTRPPVNRAGSSDPNTSPIAVTTTEAPPPDRERPKFAKEAGVIRPAVSFAAAANAAKNNATTTDTPATEKDGKTEADIATDSPTSPPGKSEVEELNKGVENVSISDV